MTKKLSSNAEFLIDAVEAPGAKYSVRQLMVYWATERGTKGNVVTFPRKVVNRALLELEDRGWVAVRNKREGTAA
jgi:hypothetical protein